MAQGHMQLHHRAPIGPQLVLHPTHAPPRTCHARQLHRNRQPLATRASAAATQQSVGAPAAQSGGAPDRAALATLAPLGLDLSSLPSLAGKNVLVTGAARGIGFNTARMLAGLGATVYLADVDEGGLQQAQRDIAQQVPGSKVVATPRLDLARTDAVHAWCDAWLAGGEALHVLVNNAGANFMGVEPWYTEQGVAGLPQVNFVGPYTLTRRLMPCLRAAGDGARVVNVASVMHRFSDIPQDVDFFFKDWWKGGAYRNCKHANVVFTRLLNQAAQKASEERGLPKLVAVAVDPGAVYSNIWATSRILGRPPGSTVIKALFSTPQDACATSVHAAAAPGVQGGQYLARGLFARSAIVRMPWEPAAGLVSCLDWPLRQVSSGRWAAGVKAVDIAPKALAAEADGRGVALWDTAAKLAGLPPWSAGLDV